MTASRYRIVLRGRLGDHFESAFDGMTLEPGPGQTVLTGEMRDQAHLYRLLDRLRVPALDLRLVDRDWSGHPVGTWHGVLLRKGEIDTLPA